MASPTEIRKGKVILHQGAPHLVLEMMHRTQGRQAGFVQVTLRNLNSGSSTNTKLRGSDEVTLLPTDTRRLEYSYNDQEGYHFLDIDTYEDTILPEEMLEDAKLFLSEGNGYDILFIDEKAVQVQLPPAVELKVVEAPDAIRGDTASAALKPVTTETGLIVQTPLFIKTDDTIKVSSSDKSYLGRV